MRLSVRIIGPELISQGLEGLLRSLPDVYPVDGAADILVCLGLGHWPNGWKPISSADCTPPRAVLITHADPSVFVAAARLGVDVFVDSDGPVEDLRHGITAAREGRPFCSEGLLPALMEALRPDEADTAHNHDGVRPLDQLSDRQMDVVLLAAQGLRNAEIAEQLHVSVDTVKTHLKHAFSKLGVSRRSQLREHVGESFPLGNGRARSPTSRRATHPNG